MGSAAGWELIYTICGLSRLPIGIFLQSIKMYKGQGKEQTMKATMSCKTITIHDQPDLRLAIRDYFLRTYRLYE